MIVVVGVFAILGYFFGVEFDALFVTALLTIIGFSVHDTIVVFDRIRENRIRHAGEPFGAIVNHSILQTIGRSINTSLTVVVTLSALLLLGPITHPHLHAGAAASASSAAPTRRSSTPASCWWPGTSGTRSRKARASAAEPRPVKPLSR